ncbi:hypothetical protein CBR_g12406 [Chara braunii]|uniref:CCHC-type domain-containing protein n=1 Tax=Chara braunii TaxID=69332 RepID=A0A388KS27_CHABU|nr:hypothetical protein CBR_g12406 [Chara braunii]|eukprot:GBG72839.1 hypothetical protein CBR_g12406 [Chara braunii]
MQYPMVVQSQRQPSTNVVGGRRCYMCSSPNHLIRDCPMKGNGGRNYDDGRQRDTEESRDYGRRRGRDYEYEGRRRYDKRGGREEGGRTTRRHEDANEWDRRGRSFSPGREARRKQEKEDRRLADEQRRVEAQEQARREEHRRLREEEKKRQQRERDKGLVKLLEVKLVANNSTLREEFGLKLTRKDRRPKKETKSAEKRRLREEIARAQGAASEPEEAGESDEELNDLRAQAAQLKIAEKRKRGKEKVVGDSPPMTTPAKGARCYIHPVEKQTGGITIGREKGRTVTLKSVYDATTSAEKTRKNWVEAKEEGEAGPVQRATFWSEKKRHYMTMTLHELKKVCKDEGIKVAPTTTKEKASSDLADRRTKLKSAAGIPLPKSPIRQPDLGDTSENSSGERVPMSFGHGLRATRIDGHVSFRIEEAQTAPTISFNARNVPRRRIEHRRRSLGVEIRLAFEQWGGGDMAQLRISKEEVAACTSVEMVGDCKEIENFLSFRDEMDDLVRMPLDRNIGDTLIQCPALYHEAMMNTFIKAEGYRVLLEEEEEIMVKWKNEYVEAGLESLGKWDDKGTLGNAYVLPKHKDVTKSRPICPTFSEPTNTVCRKMAKGLNRMMKLVPETSHFNMGSVLELSRRLKVINSKVGRRGLEWGMEGASFDIKDMFSRLPHAAILDALDWLCEWCEGRGFKSVQQQGGQRGTG